MNDPGWASTVQKHTMWLNIMLTLLNGIVVLIRAIIVPPANSVSTKSNYLWRPHGGYGYVHNCQSAANWVCPGGHPIPFCALLSGETHLSGPWRHQNGGCTASAGLGDVDSSSKHSFSMLLAHSSCLFPSSPCSLLRRCFEPRPPTPVFLLTTGLLFHDIHYHTTPSPFFTAPLNCSLAFLSWLPSISLIAFGKCLFVAYFLSKWLGKIPIFIWYCFSMRHKKEKGLLSAVLLALF